MNDLSESRLLNKARGRRVRGALVILMGCLAIASPFFAESLALLLVGLLLVCGGLEMVETFHAADDARLRSAYLSGLLSIFAGVLLLTQPNLLLRGLAFLLAGSFLIDAVSKMIRFPEGRQQQKSSE